jgi:transcription initiation factor IIE alpha subunit
MSDESAEYTFTCPVCEETLVVNESMREALIERGCVICDTAVSSAAFASDGTADSP